MSLERLLESTIERFAVLDAANLEELVEACVRVELPSSPAAWRRAAARHRILGHLLGATGRRLAMLRRISVREPQFLPWHLGRPTDCGTERLPQPGTAQAIAPPSGRGAIGAPTERGSRSSLPGKDQSQS